MGKFIDLTGQRFGRLTVIGRAGSRKGQTLWQCRCDCGNMRIIQASSLTGGRSKSCGCLFRELSASRLSVNNYFRDEIYRDKQLYIVWSNMKQRCSNPRNPEYHLYGGRGITVCSKWENDFLEFQSWAIANGYHRGLTIDRIDNNLGYSPENCRWADMKVQSNNQRKTIMLTYNGETKALSEWADKLGVSRMTLKGRYRRGWPTEQILGEKIHKKRK